MTKVDILSAAIFRMKMGHKYLYEKEHTAKYFFFIGPVEHDK